MKDIMKPLSFVDRGYRFYPLSCKKRKGYDFYREVYCFLYGLPKNKLSVYRKAIKLYLTVVFKEDKLYVYIKEC
jgi:hypothetical protein